jgi:hypothetical protein
VPSKSVRGHVDEERVEGSDACSSAGILRSRGIGNEGERMMWCRLHCDERPAMKFASVLYASAKVLNC